jgi:hypothetical protein
VLDPYLDARRLGEVIEDLSGPALGILGAVEIDTHLDATLGARERLHDGPVRQDICRHVDFMLGAIDQGNVNVFQVLARRVVNDRRWIGDASTLSFASALIRPALTFFSIRNPGVLLAASEPSVGQSVVISVSTENFSSAVTSANLSGTVHKSFSTILACSSVCRPSIHSFSSGGATAA